MLRTCNQLLRRLSKVWSTFKQNYMCLQISSLKMKLWEVHGKLGLENTWFNTFFPRYFQVKQNKNKNENKNKNPVWEFQGMNKLPKKVRKTFISLLTKLQNSVSLANRMRIIPKKRMNKDKGKQINKWMKRSHGLPAKKEEALSVCVCILKCCVQRNPLW